MILSPSGTPATHEARRLSDPQADLLRRMKVFLGRHGYREGLFCNRCDASGVPSGTHASVTDRQIRVTCRCTTRGTDSGHAGPPATARTRRDE